MHSPLDSSLLWFRIFLTLTRAFDIQSKGALNSALEVLLEAFARSQTFA